MCKRLYESLRLVKTEPFSYNYREHLIVLAEIRCLAGESKWQEEKKNMTELARVYPPFLNAISVARISL